jgi:transposase
MSLIIGIDASKEELVIATWPASVVVRVQNTPDAIGCWLKSVPPEACLGIEATGRCHLALANLAVHEGRSVFVLNPRDVHYYARSIGQRGKTDRMDAQVIARYVAHEKERLRAYSTPPAALSAIETLLRQRAQVTAACVALRQSLAHSDNLAEARDLALAELGHLIDQIDRTMRSHLHEHADRQSHWKRLQTIPGIGPLTAALLVSLFERIAFERADALVAFSGLDPRPCDSGRHRGRRVLTKRGPSEVRRLLFLAAMTFARSPQGKPLYARYRDRHLSATATFVILARKLLRIAWTLHRKAVDFDPCCLKTA